MALVNLYDPANRVPNPGFETNDGTNAAPWLRAGAATLFNQGYEGSWCMGLYGEVGGGGDTGSNTIGKVKNLVAGRVYQLQYVVRLRPDFGSGSIQLQVSISRDGVSFITLETYTGTSTTWTARGPFSFTATATVQSRVQFNVPIPTGFFVQRYYDIDAVQVEDVTPPSAPVAGESLTQAENTPGDVRFQRGVSDEVHGTLHKEGDVSRDYDERLRDKRDFVLPDADWLRRHLPHPGPRNRRPL